MIYLDHAATSFPKPDPVYRRMDEFVRSAGANPGRGGHRLARQAEAMIEETRGLLARLVGSRRPERVVFGLNASHGLNMAIKGTLLTGDHVVTSVLSMEEAIEGVFGAGSASPDGLKTVIDPSLGERGR